jgi:integrase/recombinase XerD
VEPFLHHVSKGGPVARRTISLKAPKKLPRVLTAVEAQAVLDACTRLRDRYLFAVLHESGVRIGEALGLRHEDIDAAERELSVVPRLNDNVARTKARQPRQRRSGSSGAAPTALPRPSRTPRVKLPCLHGCAKETLNLT